MGQTKASVRKKVLIPIQKTSGTFVTFHGLHDGHEHIAIGLGPWDVVKSPLVRLHSECLTGDVFGSARCDCGDQLQEAMLKLEDEGGILLYLRQEGRGIGLYNKLDAYELQQQGMDTYEANRFLGFGEDERTYLVAAQMLDALGIGEIRLLSNNPDKRNQLEKHGIIVNDFVTTGVFLKNENRNYLSAKVEVTGHKIALNGDEKCFAYHALP
jgi:GTP cyclohydrolase II